MTYHKSIPPVVKLLSMLLLVYIFMAVPQPVQANQTATELPNAPHECEPDGTQTSGAIYRICMPATWNNELVVFAHGYVSPTAPVGIPENQLVLNGVSLADTINAQGYAFATTSYSTNGLSILNGLADLVDLVNVFTEAKGAPTKVYLIGVSEGGIIAVLGLERHPDVFDGGLAMCGPYGDFPAQINYWGDFRGLFDYFFPGLMEGSPISIPQSLMDNWTNYYQTTILPAIQSADNASLVDQLFATASVPYGPDATAAAKESAFTDLLWYNVFATNDGIEKLGGQPFHNQNRVYAGSNDDTALNQAVQRYSADQAAVDTMNNNYQTTGVLTVPLVTLHTTRDHVVPYWHATLYRSKTLAADNFALHEHFEADADGHCTFGTFTTLAAFNRMVAMVADPPAYQAVTKQYLPLVPATR